MLAAQVLHSVEMGLLLLALCILIGPLVAERLRVPGLVGLIAIGMVLGPGALEWLRPGGFVATVGAAGLLYLMFLAGVELDLRTFAANRAAAITFGLLTFAVPFALSFAVGRWQLELGTAGAALIGAMWASHTVVAYPEVKAAGLERNRAVGAAVAATVITDLLALIVLAVAASSVSLDEEPGARAATEDPALPLWGGLILLVVGCLVVLPRLTRWVFVHHLHSRQQRFVWMLAGLSGGAILGLLGGIEGLVGAFLAGIGMNSSVPARGELMERIEFVGGSLLVPAFLVSVGLSIDPGALVDPETLRQAAVFTGLVVTGKTLPALMAGRIFGFSRGETAIMAALTIGQAAATLAIAQVGVRTGLLDQEVLNAAVVTVVASVLITSFGTRMAARSVEVLNEEVGSLGEHILALAPPQEQAQTLALVVSALAGPEGGLVTPFTTMTSEAVGEDLAAPDRADRLSALNDELIGRGHDTHPITRVGVSIGSAARSLAQEVRASAIVLGLDRAAAGFADADDVTSAAPTPCVVVIPGADLPTRVKVLTLGGGGPSSGSLPAQVADRLSAAIDCPVEPLARGDLTQGESDEAVVVSSLVLDSMGPLARRAALRSTDATIVLVGDAGRLRLSAASPPRPSLGIVGQRMDGDARP